MPRAYAELFGKDRLWHGRLNLRAFEGGEPSSLAPLLDLMSVRYYTAPTGPDRFVQWTFLGALGEVPTRRGSFWVARRGQALPRVYAVGRARMEPNPDRAREILAGPSFDPRREAIVSEGKELEENQPGSARVASIRSYAHDEVVIDAVCDAPCLLVLTDLHYPGWEASVDGRRATIVPANIAFRGLFLDSGAHQVVYRFRPRSLWLGLAVAGVAILAVAVSGLRRARRGCRRSAFPAEEDVEPISMRG